MSEEKVYCKGCRYHGQDPVLFYEAISVNRENNCQKYKRKPWWMFWRG